MAWETLGFRRARFSRAWSTLLVPAFSLPSAPAGLTTRLRGWTGRSPTNQGYCPSIPRLRRQTLAPLHFRRRIARPVCSHALFGGWLLLSPPPGCPRDPTSFSTLSLNLGALAGGLGCFPLGAGAYPRRLTPRARRRGIRSLDSARRQWLAWPSALPPHPNARGCTSMHFGENQLSPGSLGISPLPTAPPTVLLHRRVRASIPPYGRDFTLAMGSSPGFGSNPSDAALFGLAFAAAPYL